MPSGAVQIEEVDRSGEVSLALQFEGLLRVGGVDRVVQQARGEVAPYRAGRRFPAPRGADHLPDHSDGVPAFQDHADARATADEGHQVAEERLVLVDGIELLGLGARHGLHAYVDGLEAALLEAPDDVADEALGGRVRLDDYESPFDRREGHYLLGTPRPLVLARVTPELVVVQLALVGAVALRRAVVEHQHYADAEMDFFTAECALLRTIQLKISLLEILCKPHLIGI
jgi:hypothetical protein